MQRGSVVEADEEVLADSVGIDECRSAEIDTDEARVAGDAPLAMLALKPVADRPCQSPDGVALGHGGTVARSSHFRFSDLAVHLCS
jgi:hypothetical protein